MTKFSLNSTIVDFVAKTEKADTWRMVLVEQGPWEEEEIDNELYRIQNRLYDCIDAALEGQLAKKFPETLDKVIIIQFDAYDIASRKFYEFYEAFSSQVLETPDYAKGLADNAFVKGIKFQLNTYST